MYLTEYETTVVIRPDVSGDLVEATLDRMREAVTSHGGKLLAINHWGKKRLAYEIQKHTRGIYVHTHYLGVGKLVSELERNLRLSDNVLRFLTVKIEDRVLPDSRETKAYEAPRYDEVDEESSTLDEDVADEAAPPTERAEGGDEEISKVDAESDSGDETPEPS